MSPNNALLKPAAAPTINSNHLVSVECSAQMLDATKAAVAAWVRSHRVHVELSVIEPQLHDATVRKPYGSAR